LKRGKYGFRTTAAAAALAALVLAFSLVTTGCKSYWIDTSVENQTGQPIPTASFGTNTLAPGGVMHYRFQIRGSGPVKVEYTSPDGKTVHGQGLTLEERQQGELGIRLLPQGKVEFLPKLQPGS